MHSIRCKITGHDMTHVAVVTLYPGSGGDLLRRDVCERCGKYVPGGAERLDPDWDFFIRQALPEITHPTVVYLDDKHPLAYKR